MTTRRMKSSLDSHSKDVVVELPFDICHSTTFNPPPKLANMDRIHYISARAAEDLKPLEVAGDIKVETDSAFQSESSLLVSRRVSSTSANNKDNAESSPAQDQQEVEVVVELKDDVASETRRNGFNYRCDSVAASEDGLMYPPSAPPMPPMAVNGSTAASRRASNHSVASVSSAPVTSLPRAPSFMSTTGEARRIPPPPPMPNMAAMAGSWRDKSSPMPAMPKHAPPPIPPRFDLQKRSSVYVEEHPCVESTSYPDLNMVDEMLQALDSVQMQHDLENECA